jgi:hypothetical protein
VPVSVVARPAALGQDVTMVGAVIIVILLVVVVPVAVIASGGVLAAIIGAVLKSNGEKTHEGSELLDTNV